MKKLIILVFSILLLSSFMIVYAVDTNTSDVSIKFQKNRHYNGSFTDVSKDEWFYEDVVAAYEYGLIDGLTDTTFSPNGDITIAQAIKLASCLHSIYYYGELNFKQSIPWYKTYLDYALNNDIIANSNVIGDALDYDAPATRFEFIQILAGAFPGDALTEINIVTAIPDVINYLYSNGLSGESVYKFYRAGILTGTDEKGSFSSNYKIKRNEVAAIVVRMANPEMRKHFNLPEPIILPVSDLKISYSQDDYDEIFSNDGLIEQVPIIFDGNDAVLTWSNSAMDNYRRKDLISDNQNDYWETHRIYYSVFVDSELYYSTSKRSASLSNLPKGKTVTIEVIPQIIINPINEVLYGEATNLTITTPEPKISEPAHLIDGYGYDPIYGASINSADGVDLRWSGANNTGKTLKYYTAHLSFWNAVLDPAYDEITGMASKDVKYVGPVQNGGGMTILGIVTYNSSCSFIKIEAFTVEYMDGTTERIPYNHIVKVK